ncbi:Alpha/Beta hydrolase protein [Lasiosphaeria hispida]|uniref:Alpha/Beta hydrolase protein n=1 Tax=Lasiosphaeria hispida TaxID=260671 RepID=A0AAJ0MBE9_9PEZI|nr:Alpha/Beta hydrolase protein [Lasiosphaeria hispida]
MPAPEWSNIRPAALVGDPVYSSEEGKNETGFCSMSLSFGVPLEHHKPDRKTDTLTLHSTLVYADHDPDTNMPGNEAVKDWAIKRRAAQWHKIVCRRPFMLYLCGGPGDGNNHRRIPGLNRWALDQGYQVLYVDYRGTGRSRPFIDNAHLSEIGSSPADRAAYLALFRQDNIARDLEAIRLCLIHPKNLVKWTLVGQSFGGWVALTYASFLPSSLAAIYLTAGLAPVGRSPRDVYTRLYRRVAERNEAYYRMFPDDVDLVRKIAVHLYYHAPGPITREDGGGYAYRVEGHKGKQRLTAQLFLTLGRCFGAMPTTSVSQTEEGEKLRPFHRVHALVQRMAADIASEGVLSEETVAEYVAMQTKAREGGPSCAGFRLHERPLYGVMHEAIYCHGPGVVAGWAARDVGRAYDSGEFSWLRNSFEGNPAKGGRLFFAGEMIFPSMLAAGGSSLRAFRDAAEVLAQKDDWPALYDEQQLSARNRVPMRAIAYKDDMYVDLDLSLETGAKIRKCVVVEAKEGWGHGAIKEADKSDQVLEMLFGSKTPSRR